MDQIDHPAPRERAIKEQRHKLMAGGHKLDGDKSGQRERVTRGITLEMVVGGSPRKALPFHKDLNGEWRNTQAKNFQALGTACHGPEGTVLGSLGRARRSEWLQQTSGDRVMGKDGRAQARGCPQELGARFVWSEFHFNKDSLAALWGINCRGQG